MGKDDNSAGFTVIPLQQGKTYRCYNGQIITVESFTTPTGLTMFRPWDMRVHLNDYYPLPARPYEGYTFSRCGICNEDADFDILEEVVATVDLNKCKGGERLVSRHGWVLTYIGKRPNSICADVYPHTVLYPNGQEGSRCDDGYVFKSKRLIDDIDIVEVLEGIPRYIKEPNII
jgi:hypothetical protein